MKAAKRRLTNAVCLVLCGLGVGWLIGLSVSPVLHIIVTSIIAFVVSVVSALAGVRIGVQAEPSGTDKTTHEKMTSEDAALTGAAATSARTKVAEQVSIVPLTLLIVGLAMGSSFGVYARTNEWLSPNLARAVAKWGKTGLSEQAIYQRLFDQSYAAPSSNVKEEPATAGVSKTYHQGALFSGPSKAECGDFLNLKDEKGDALKNRMLIANEEYVQRFAARCQAPADLKIFVEEVLCHSSNTAP